MRQAMFYCIFKTFLNPSSNSNNQQNLKKFQDIKWKNFSEIGHI